MNRLYTRLVSFLVLTLARYCLKRGRYVDYTHQGRTYMRRYAIAGWLTGDARAADYLEPPAHANAISRAWDYVTMALLRIRSYLPNLYLHQMINPDADPCLHDHPWPWAVSFVALGGYREVRNAPGPDHQLEKILTDAWHVSRTLTAPALNFLRGNTFHRIAEVRQRFPKPMSEFCRLELPYSGFGTWTLFLAGPRRHAKPWGYLVPGQGYVSHRERHENFGGEEKRGEPIDV